MSTTSLNKNNSLKLKKLVLSGVFAAIAYASIYIFRFNVMFLTFDIKDVIITIAGLILGPIPAAAISLAVAGLEAVTVSSTEAYGFLMNFASSCILSVSAALIYKFTKKLWGAILGLFAGVVLTVAIMMVLNILITPLYMKVPTSEVLKLIPTVILPFNITKGLFNVALAIVFYKPVSRALKASGVLSQSELPSERKGSTKVVSTIIALAIGIVLLAVAVVMFFVVLDGKVTYFTAFEDLINKFK